MWCAIAATNDAVATGGLGFIERLVGVVEPQGRVSVCRVEGGKADAQADSQRRALLIAQGGEAITQGIHGGRRARERKVREDHAEFVAAVAPGNIRRAQVLLEHFAQLTHRQRGRRCR